MVKHLHNYNEYEKIVKQWPYKFTLLEYISDYNPERLLFRLGDDEYIIEAGTTGDFYYIDKIEPNRKGNVISLADCNPNGYVSLYGAIHKALTMIDEYREPIKSDDPYKLHSYVFWDG